MRPIGQPPFYAPPRKDGRLDNANCAEPLRDPLSTHCMPHRMRGFRRDIPFMARSASLCESARPKVGGTRHPGAAFSSSQHGFASAFRATRQRGDGWRRPFKGEPCPERFWSAALPLSSIRPRRWSSSPRSHYPSRPIESPRGVRRRSASEHTGLVPRRTGRTRLFATEG